MPTTSEQFITSMKLRELRKQRTLLMSAYDRLDRRLATVPNEANRLQARNSFGIKPSVYSEIDLWKDNDRIVESELWEDFSTMEEKVRQKLNTEDLLRYWVSSSSILSQRASLKSGYRDLSLIDRYGLIC